MEGIKKDRRRDELFSMRERGQTEEVMICCLLWDEWDVAWMDGVALHSMIPKWDKKRTLFSRKIRWDFIVGVPFSKQRRPLIDFAFRHFWVLISSEISPISFGVLFSSPSSVPFRHNDCTRTGGLMM